MLSPVKIWRNQQKIKKILGLRGKIIAFTVIHVPPCGFEAQAPYAVAVAELEDRSRYTAQLVDWAEKHLKTGQKIRTILRRTKHAGDEGVIPYGIKFKPVE